MTDPMQTEREAFEAWAYLAGCWNGWKARAELASETASELRSLRDALALAKSRIAELTEALEMMLEFPKTGPAITAARAALKEDSE